MAKEGIESVKIFTATDKEELENDVKKFIEEYPYSISSDDIQYSVCYIPKELPHQTVGSIVHSMVIFL
jgi:hypothetical protein